MLFFWTLSRRLAALACAAILSLAAVDAFAGGANVDSDGTMDFEFNFRFPPDRERIDQVREQLQVASEILCDATDGAIRFEQVRLTGGAMDEATAAIWYHADAFRSHAPVSSDPTSVADGSHISLALNAFAGDIIAHELGHYAFGMGDSYDEQRRFGGACGIGFSFDPGAIDERNHSIMQMTGNLRCGSSTAPGCIVDSDCSPGVECVPILMSELSVPGNHDPIRGDGTFCPMGMPTTQLLLPIDLNDNVGTTTFDPTSFATADATATDRLPGFELADSTGKLNGDRIHELFVYLEHTGNRAWTLHFAIDDGEIDGGTAGDLRLLRSVALTFRNDGSLDTPDPPETTIDIIDLANGADDLSIDVTLDFEELSFGSTRAWFFSGGSFDTGVGQRRSLMDGLGDCSGGDPFCDPNSTSPVPCCRRWNNTTFAWESSQQTLINNESDWETLNRFYPFVSIPAGLPVEAPPTSCATAVDFIEEVEGVDQVLLLIDKSGSMEDPVKKDGEETRLDFAKAAARAYIDLFADRGGDLSIFAFSGENDQDKDWSFIGDGGSFTGSLVDLAKQAVDGNSAGGKTAIGSALRAAKEEFDRVNSDGRSRAIFLLSDGENNRGPNPRDVAEELADEGIRIFSIPVGKAADRKLLADIAERSGAALLDAPIGDELPPIYGELFARFLGDPLALPRTESAVMGFVGEPVIAGATAGDGQVAAAFPDRESFTFEVEAEAERLNLLVSTRNPFVQHWSPNFVLTGPNGETITETGPEVSSDDFYRLISLIGPAPGTWTLEISTASTVAQLSYVQAHVENSRVDCFADAIPKVVTGSSPVAIRASTNFILPVEGAAYAGVVQRPNGSFLPLPGSIVPLPPFEPLGLEDGAQSLFSNYAGRGVYQALVQCRSGADAQVVQGESIFEGPPRPEGLEVPDFVRVVRTSFFVDTTTLPPCTVSDCDGDGIPNSVEGTNDTDGDGLPDDRDDDADGDDIPDAIEGDGDTDGDGTPDFQDPDSDNDGYLDADEGNQDTDGDGTPDFRDEDSDNDGIPDADEPPGDLDGDGTPNRQDTDSDGDGILDGDDPFPFSITVAVDIKPGSCPNSWNRSSRGVLPTAILGSADFDPADIDVTTLAIARADGVSGSVAPNQGPPGPHPVIVDVATPFEGDTCGCHELEADGTPDLMTHFRTEEVATILGLDDQPPGALVELVVTGTLVDGTSFVGSDCVRLVPPGSGPAACNIVSNKSDAWIHVSPLDETLTGGGFASFRRTFPGTTQVTLWPEPEMHGAPFTGWRLDGDFIPAGPLTGSSLQVLLDGDHEIEAVYQQRGCGLGFELAIAAGALLAARRRTRCRF